MSDLPPELLCQIAENLLPTYDWPNRPFPLEQATIAPLLTVSSGWHNALRPLLYRAVDLSSEVQARGFLDTVRREPETICTRRIRLGFARPLEEPESGVTKGDDTYAEQWHAIKTNKLNSELALVDDILDNLGGSVKRHLLGYAVASVCSSLVTPGWYLLTASLVSFRSVAQWDVTDVERFTFQAEAMLILHDDLPERFDCPAHITHFGLVTTKYSTISLPMGHFLQTMANAAGEGLKEAYVRLERGTERWAASTLIQVAANLRVLTIDDRGAPPETTLYAPPMSIWRTLFDAASHLDTLKFYQTPWFLGDIPIRRLKRLIIDQRCHAREGDSWDDLGEAVHLLSLVAFPAEKFERFPAVFFESEEEVPETKRNQVHGMAILLRSVRGCTLTINGVLIAAGELDYLKTNVID